MSDLYNCSLVKKEPSCTQITTYAILCLYSLCILVFLIFYFCMENSQKSGGSENSIFNVLSPKQTFVVGLVGGFMTLCTIGFFILGSMYLNGSKGFADSGSGAAPLVQNPPVDDEGNVDPKNIVVREVNEKTDHIRGNKKAKVTIVEYSDFECPFCQRFHPTMKQILDKYGKDIRVVYRHFPLSFHPQATPAALASECASEQGKFWEMHDKLFEAGVSASGSYTDYAQSLGLNTSKFDSCMKEQKYLSRIKEDQTDGQNAGVQGTPHSIILGPKGEKIPVSGAQPFEAVEAALKQVL